MAGLKTTKTRETIDPMDLGVTPTFTKAPSLEEEIFRPTPEMRRIKAEFLNRIRGMSIDLRTVDVEKVQSLVKCERLLMWWRNPEFETWFRNGEEHRIRVKFLMDKHLDNLEEILTNRTQEYSVRDMLAAGKQLMDLNQTFSNEDLSAQDSINKLMLSPEKIKQLAAEVLEQKRKDSNKRVTPAPLLPTD